ncbi:MAG: acyl-CoA dehydratase activase [candidate division Zixibacteria bacterium]|nr:acyl-CoA dehydratase activase [candidate division Zixibacteria bacterium]MDH3937040.1 acyl-CoA dehydratase activase [candidate division Zixibacteria bacterium]
MITAGIDVGSKTIKVVVLKDGAVIGKAVTATGFDQAQSAAMALGAAVEKAGIDASTIAQIVSTGAGRKAVEQANSQVTEVGADAVGTVHAVPEARTVIDVGAEEGRGIKVSGEGKVVDFAVNEKCAAGAGSFAESMSRALEVTLDEFGKLSLESTRTIPMNAQCTVFAESEVVSLLHAETPKEDISRAVHDAIASRVASMVRRVGLEQKVALIGGVAYNPGFVDSLTRTLECEIVIPQDREYVGALGAALVAVERSKND